MKSDNNDISNNIEIFSQNEKENLNAISNKKHQKQEILNQVTRGDLLLFKEEILQTIRELKNELNNKITEKFDSYNKLVESSNQKLYKYEFDKNTFLSLVTFAQEKNEILSEINKLKNELKTEINVNTLHINNCEMEVSNMGFKYDRIISNNLLVPGIIGPMCKFENLKDYIIDNRKEIPNLINNVIQFKDELKKIKKNISEFKDVHEKFLKTIEPMYQEYVNVNITQLENKIKREIELVNKKISEVRIENIINVQNSQDKEKQQNEYSKKIEEIQKNNEENKKLYNYTLSRLEKNLAEFINVKKCVLELSNVFAKHKRSYGDENLNENKREVIMNFGNMVSSLIKDLSNDKKKLSKKLLPNMADLDTNNNVDSEKNNKKEYIDAKPYSLNQSKRKSNDQMKNRNSLRKINNFLSFKNNNKDNLNEIKKTLFSNYISKETNPNDNKIMIKDETSTSPNKNSNIKIDKIILNDEDCNINSSRFSTIKEKKINYINDKNSNQNKLDEYIKDIENNNGNLKDQINEKVNIKIIKNKMLKNRTDGKLITGDIYNNSIASNDNSIFIKKNANNFVEKEQKNGDVNGENIILSIMKNNEQGLSSRTAKITSLNFRNKKLKDKIFLKENTKEKNAMFHSEKKFEKSKGKKSVISDELHFKSQFNKKYRNFNGGPESLSEEYTLTTGNKINKKKVLRNIDSYNSLTYKQYGKELYYDKSIEKELNYIKDKDIIDEPLISNQENFKLIEEKGGIDKKLLELEFFTKKKFDELVKEIKNFIPIHFNSHLKDYTLFENSNRYKIRK